METDSMKVYVVMMTDGIYGMEPRDSIYDIYANEADADAICTDRRFSVVEFEVK